MKNVEKKSSLDTNETSSKSHINVQTAPLEDITNLQLILDEKNRIINILKKRIHNQRIQLEFYIKKEMNGPVMIQIAKTCLPELSNDNMTVALAMSKFCRESGVKTPMRDVYDRVYKLTGRTNAIVQAQETLLSDFIKKMKEHMTPSEIKTFLGNFDINTNYIEMFNNFLETTVGLKRCLGSFLSCCDRLVNAEERRTEVVEHIYSLPQEERTICNYLVNVQMEKNELEETIKQITKKQKTDENNLDEIDVIENNLQLLHDSFEYFQDDKDEEIGVTKMLEKVYKQAMSLLCLSRDQRTKYTQEIKQLKAENDKLREIIQHIETRKPTKNSNLNDVEKLYNIIKKTINETQKYEHSKSKELREKSEECEKLKQRLDEMGASRGAAAENYPDSSGSEFFDLSNQCSYKERVGDYGK